MNYVSYFEKRKLLTDGKSNTKTAKNSLRTYYLSLQPVSMNVNKENLCKFSTKECRSMCLQFAGRQSFSNVVNSRQMKTDFYVSNRKEFLGKLWNELTDINAAGKAAIRLNLLSDVNWDSEISTIGKDMNDLKNIQFYDYTKDPTKVEFNSVENYHLTYSYSGGNWAYCDRFLQQQKANVAVVFKNTVPLSYKGFTVINGDLSDERFLDPKGVIVGLKYKTPKGVKYSKNKFVVEI